MFRHTIKSYPSYFCGWPVQGISGPFVSQSAVVCLWLNLPWKRKGIVLYLKYVLLMFVLLYRQGRCETHSWMNWCGYTKLRHGFSLKNVHLSALTSEVGEYRSVYSHLFEQYGPVFQVEEYRTFECQVTSKKYQVTSIWQDLFTFSPISGQAAFSSLIIPETRDGRRLRI